MAFSAAYGRKNPEVNFDKHIQAILSLFCICVDKEHHFLEGIMDEGVNE